MSDPFAFERSNLFTSITVLFYLFVLKLRTDARILPLSHVLHVHISVQLIIPHAIFGD